MRQLTDYRYRLERDICPSGDIVMAYIGINPSLADEYIDDNTVKNLKVFSANNNARKMIVGNVFAYRSTDVKGLSKTTEPVGIDNDKELELIINEADILVPFWGSRTKLRAALRPRLDDVMAMLIKSGKPIKVLGVTASNDPRHPQGVSYSTKLIPLHKKVMTALTERNRNNR